jgi:TonB family protein
VKSIPLLDQAALDAVSQWEFTPFSPNGTPVPLRLTMSVTFRLQ